MIDQIEDLKGCFDLFFTLCIFLS